MEWILLGVMSYILFTFHQRLSRLENGKGESQVPDREELLPMVDVASRAVDRHVQDYHTKR
jgi:hypothetical protein